MHKFTLHILPLFLLAASGILITSSCSRLSNRNETSLADSVPRVTEFESFTYDMVAFTREESLAAPTDSTLAWRIVGDGILPKKIGSHDITLLRDTLLALAHVDMETKGKFIPEVDESLYLTDSVPSRTSCANSVVNSLSLDLLTPYVMVWERYVYISFWGAAHGDYSTDYINYSAIDNRVLSLSDLFVAGYEDDLLELVRQKIKDNEVMLNVTPDEITLPENFRIRNNGISLIYPIYSIAPYSEGEVKIDLSVYDLEGLLTPRSLEMILGAQSN